MCIRDSVGTACLFVEILGLGFFQIGAAVSYTHLDVYKRQVVGVQPFGGQGLSGTGPKAGGPHYLPRFATEKTVTINTLSLIHI